MTVDESGVLYILTNPFMPELVKIGCTTGHVEDRIKQLSSSTGVPVAFQCYFAARVENMALKEKRLHQLFSDKRVNPNREFFQIAPEKVVLAIAMGAFTEVTPGKVDLPMEEEAAASKAEQAQTRKRANINLAAINIPLGALLTLSRDEGVHATVVEGNKVKFEGQIMSLSASALEALRKLGYKTGAASGSDYWMFEGITLDEIRKAAESGRDEPTPE